MDAGLIKVVSWNIRFGLDIDGAEAALRDVDELRSADVLLLQEMDGPGVDKLADGLGLHAAFASSGIHAKTERDFGNAILTPAPLRDRTVVELPHQARVGGHPRVAISARVDLGGREVTVCSTHTETPALSAARRVEQFAAVAGFASSWPTACSIVGGDFNTVTTRGIRKLTALFDEAGHAPVSLEAVTMRRGGRSFALDHLFARGLSPVASGVVRGLDASDHAPIWVVLEPDMVDADRVDEED